MEESLKADKDYPRQLASVSGLVRGRTHETWNDRRSGITAY